MSQRFYSLLGFCRAAGKVCAGYNTCELAINGDRARLVVIAEDGAPNTKEYFFQLAQHRSVPVVVYGTSEGLGRAIGKGKRVVLCILDRHFATSLLRAAGEEAEC